MTRQSLLRTAVGVAAAGCIGLAASPAFATTTTTSPVPASPRGAGANAPAVLAKIQAAAKVAIDQRVTALNAVVAVLNGTTWLGPDQGTLVGVAQNDISGLTALEAKIAADTTVQQAKTDAQTIFTGFRVFALVIPVDHMVRASDGVTNVVVPKLTTLESKWAGLMDPDIATLLTDMQNQTQAANTAVTGLPTTLEALTPDSWNKDHQVLDTPRSQLATARQDLKKARDDAQQIAQILRSEHHQGASSVNPSSTTSSSTTSSTVGS